MVPEPTPKETPIALGPPTPKPTPTPTPKPTPSPTPRPTLVPTPTKTQAPEAVNVEIPKVAETPVLLPTTKYSIFDMFKNKTSTPKPTHQTAPPGTNFSPVASQTSGEFSTPPPLIYYYPVIKKK